MCHDSTRQAGALKYGIDAGAYPTAKAGSEFVQLFVGERLYGWPNKEILLDRPNFGDLVKSDEPTDGFEIQIFQGRHIDVCEQAANGKRNLLCIFGEAAFEGELFKVS